MRNADLEAAVNVFRELGWAEADWEELTELPPGTKKQRQAALKGLKNGDWGEFAEIGKNTYGWRSYVDADTEKLALFAVCMGVNARRAAGVMRGSDKEAPVDVIAGRGAGYASDFINFACISRRRMSEHSASAFGNLAVRLVDKLNLAIPQNAEYLKDWAVYAAAAMGLRAERRYGEQRLPDPALIAKRFEAHVRAGVALNVPATGPFGTLLPAGVKRGWLSREEAVRLAFAALGASVRPGDRKVWLDVLEALEVDDDGLSSRVEELIPLLASGDNTVIVRLAPGLIARSEGDVLTEVLVAAFSAATKKAKRLVLTAALARPRPENVGNLESWLALLAADPDRGIASLASRLAEQWEIEAEAPAAEETGIQGLWQPAPPVWQVPVFEMGEISPAALTELAAQVAGRRELVHDVVTERFLAMAAAVAYRNPEAARTSLRGLRSTQHLLASVISWVKGEAPRYGFDTEDSSNGIKPPLMARDYAVCLRLGQLPCLLSTPGKVDLSIHLSDLAARIALYQRAEADILEADLLLALTRLDIGSAAPKARAALCGLDVPVVRQSGERMSETADQIVSAYLEDPVIEPPLNLSSHSYWRNSDIAAPKSMREFPDRMPRYESELFAVFPLWGDISLRAVRWDSEVYHEQGLILRQVARRGTPLPPGASVNLLASQRSMTPDAAEDSMRAVSEAWERGLLRPGTAETALLDWSTKTPSNLAALAAALDSIARDGMLAVIWPILDALITASLKAPRLLSGTAELARLISDFLPEVRAAVEQGHAEQHVLLLPGVRALARRGGASRAAETARTIAALLPPEAADSPAAEPAGAPLPELPPFEEVWPASQEGPVPIEDGVAVAVDSVQMSSSKRLLLFTLVIPGIADRVFQVVNNGWYYDLEREGQCNAFAAVPGTAGFSGNRDERVWLHWDAERNTMVACEHRNWVAGKDGPLSGTLAAPLPASLLTVLIGLLAQDGDAVYYAPRLLRQFIKSGDIGAAVIRRAMGTLLRYPAVSPAKLVRPLEKDVKLLPVLWPVLTAGIAAAGAQAAGGAAPPVWVNRILDIALRFAPYLAEAARRGYIPPEDAAWAGLTQLALSKSKSAAVGKAKELEGRVMGGYES